MSFGLSAFHRRLTMVTLATAFTGLATSSVFADTPFPNRNLTIVVAFPPGGPPDIVARSVGPMMSEVLGKPVIVENRPGASATIAASGVARSAPDGHTMLSADLSLAVSPYVVAKVSYDPLKDFKFVVLTARTNITAVIDPKLPIKNVADFVAAAKKDPTSIKAAHTGIGTPPHLGLISFLQGTGTSVLQVPYKGAAIAIQDIVAGHITMLFTGPSTSIALARDGRVRMLGVSGNKRLRDLPDVPTFAESGVDMGGMKNGQYFGLAVPAATPDSVVAKINAAVNAAIKDPGVREKLEKVGFEVVGGTPEEFSKFFKEQSAAWRQVLQNTKTSSK